MASINLAKTCLFNDFLLGNNLWIAHGSRNLKGPETFVPDPLMERAVRDSGSLPEQQTSPPFKIDARVDVRVRSCPSGQPLNHAPQSDRVFTLGHPLIP